MPKKSKFPIFSKKKTERAYNPYILLNDNKDAPDLNYLYFSSNFECGNLERVDKRTDLEYDVFIRGDYEIPRHKIWYFFRIENYLPNQRVILHLNGLSKKKTLFRDGFGPVIRSSSNLQWERLPQNQILWYQDPDRDNNYILSLFIEFKDDKYTEFAYAFPYSYTQLQKYLFFLNSRKLQYFSCTTLCRSLNYKKINLLSFATNTSIPHKPTIIITSRVHPGETPSSYIMEGIIDTITNASCQSNTSNGNIFNDIKQYYDIYLIPMLNPDGVSIGNYRTNSLGYDLNRVWNNPTKEFQPPISYVKDFIQQIYNDHRHQLEFFIDIHGHTASSNSIFYISPHSIDVNNEHNKCNKFIQIFEQFCKYFQSNLSQFKESQDGSAKYVLSNLYPNVDCFTFENSFSHYYNKNGDKYFYTINDYKEVGKNLIESLLYFKKSYSYSPIYYSD